MNVVFMGTPDFAAASLNTLLQSSHRVSAVFCQPDKPAGRGMRMQACPVKLLAERHNITVYQPKRLRDGEALTILRSLAPDLLAVVAYGRFLPPDILELPPLGCVNVHASLLPALRGAAPIQRAVARGLPFSGVTTQYMAEEMDTGDIILQESCPIRPEDTAGDLHDRLKGMGAALLLQTLDRIQRGDAPRIPQDHSAASYAPILRKSDGQVDWCEPLDAVDCRIRGMSPWPGAFSGSLRIHEAHKSAEQCQSPPGTVLPGGGIVCGDGGVLRLRTVQCAGGRRMDIDDYLRGHTLEIEL